jgi:secreted trypsin-like serine protease
MVICVILTKVVLISAGSTACIGDGGGGIALKNRRKWYLRGLVSFGYTFKKVVDQKRVLYCNGTVPSLYVDLTNNMDWIKQTAFPA